MASFDPVSAVFEVGGKLIDRLWPDPALRDAAKLKLVELQQTGELAKLAANTDLAKGQLGINLEEAKSTNWFVAGWRPAVGWCCGIGFAYAAVIEPIARFASTVIFGYAGDFPAIDTSLTIQVLFGILGLGAMRTYEKKQGAEGNR